MQKEREIAIMLTWRQKIEGVTNDQLKVTLKDENNDELPSINK